MNNGQKELLRWAENNTKATSEDDQGRAFIAGNSDLWGNLAAFLRQEGGFVARELQRIESEIAVEPQDSDRFRQLFVAQQALAWTSDPQFFASPLDSINGKTGTMASINPLPNGSVE